MKIELDGLKIKVFSISPPTMDKNLFWKNIDQTVLLSEKYGYTGILIFTGNDNYVDPWLVAQHVFKETKTLSPLVAVNPIYMHPYTAAKMISSFGYLYGRKTYLNCVLGKAKSDLASFKDSLSRAAGYERLEEYFTLLLKLLGSKSPVTYHGKFYQVENLHLLPHMDEKIHPELYLAGSSDAAREVVGKLGATRVSMAGSPSDPDFHDYARQGVYCGLIARKSRQEAWETAYRLFPDNQQGMNVHKHLQDNSNATWKAELWDKAQKAKEDENPFWLKPFETFQADCPYYVGSYDDLADLLTSAVMSGTSTFILDIVPEEEEYVHINRTFELMEERLKEVLDKGSKIDEENFFNFNL